MAGRVRVLSERLMVPGKEPLVRDVMERVVARVRRQPGFLSGDVMRDVDRPEVCALDGAWRGGGELVSRGDAGEACPAKKERRRGAEN